ncbi:unnamed protein product, partial [Effrenium voratum]
MRSLRLSGPLQVDLQEMIANGGLPQLQDLHLLHCPAAVVARAARLCPLRSVGIPVQPPCTAEELCDIVKATGERLQHLCLPTRVEPLESPDLGELLAQHCPNLLYLCAQSESILSSAGLEKLMQSCQKLDKLALSYVQGDCRG